MKIFKAFITSFIAIILLITLNTRIKDIPPMGKFLDPFNGFWQNAESRKSVRAADYRFSGLKSKAEILFDDHMIPHIFADNVYDAYFAQGYVTAKDRLWQMDFQTRFAAGRLSEVVGEKALELDKYQRRMGMTYGAENMLKAAEKDPAMKNILDAYAAGINAYINSLAPRDYPIEFKILDYKPEQWNVLNTAFLLKMMSLTLAGGSDEFYMSNILKKFGPEVVEDLFPDHTFAEDPIIPPGTKWDFKPLPIPPEPETPPSGINTIFHTKEIAEGTGSNNWAVAGAKSKSGYPLLANDPHLDLSLPAIWYQIQITTPEMNVYGVSIPGAPCVIIGFNEDIAWGVTNVGADVLDWYSVQFRDSSLNEYWYNRGWHPVKKRIESIKVRGAATVSDTVYYTHHGPVVYMGEQKPQNFSRSANVPPGYSLRWIAHEGSGDIWAFYLLNKAKNYSDYRKAISYNTAPAQNFVFAGRDNDIAITTNGYFPLKWKDQGKFLLDGSKPENDWHGRIPSEQNPSIKNPRQAFVSSANQIPADKTYPYYINWEFGSNDRAHRINNRLKVMTGATVDSMRILQNDNHSTLAENILPLLLRSVNTANLSATEKKGYEISKKWNKSFDADEIGASIFEIWQKDLIKRIWIDELGDPDLPPMRYPSRDRTVQLLLYEPESHWFDNIRTARKETRSDLIQTSFRFAIDSLKRKFGNIGDDWKWGNVKHTHVPHLAAFPGFGSEVLYNGGSKSSVNALNESNGPSWRMVVAVGPEVKGFGIFPGGQSGNPGSFFYDDMINTWTAGKLNELLFLKSKNEPSGRILSRLTLTKN